MREFLETVKAALGTLWLIVVFGGAVYATTLPCGDVDPHRKWGWCSPPERSLGRAAVYGLKNWWDGIVIWR